MRKWTILDKKKKKGNLLRRVSQRGSKGDNIGFQGVSAQVRLLAPSLKMTCWHRADKPFLFFLSKIVHFLIEIDRERSTAGEDR